MDRSALPDAAFVDPGGGNADAVRHLSESVLDSLLDQLTTADERSPMPADPAVPAAEVPDSSRPTDAILDDLDDVIAGSMNPAHPGYIGHMDTVPTTVSALGDLVAAAINNNMLSVEMSPVLSTLEVDLTDAIAAEFGLGPDAGGVLTSGGSLANLHALAVARNHAFDVHEGGLTATTHLPVILASEVAHTSLQKAAMILGLGTDAVVPVETDANSRMEPDALDAAVEAAEADGRDPFCVVATAGTTTTGNIDPLPEIRDVAAARGLWFHVDAAYGGALVFSERERDRLAGIEAANSVTFNPQKWCYVAKTCAMVLFAEMDHLHDEFRVGAPYMRGEDAIPNLGELSVQGTRHADVLKLWLTFQHLGRAGLTQLVDESYRLTDLLFERVRTHPALEAATEPDMNLCCFRAAPDWCPAEELDDLNGRVQESLLREHDVFVSLPTYRGSRWLRVALLNPYTDATTVDRLVGGIEAFLDGERD
ncbi:pyridoxal phosphate-dependent decarboxylase family protein [Haloarchaeobius salinus]|uniref:pyridoxal phosphate-dependent decarboxylase family protein n=1 Tax=Haloarchaeobius salinus TaxID=1198298 RepID=UPI00210B6C2B|nr:pyridoxal-dependent decarboxylase [Haloarchaeobius salinus]